MNENKNRALRCVIDGNEPDEELYFAYSATLRIFGNIEDLNDITNNLGFEPTSFHKKGERRRPKSPPYQHDMWSYESQIDEEVGIETHINELWTKLKPHKEYLLELKKTLNVDVFLGYRSNSDTTGIEVPYPSLEMFTELKIPFGLSIIVT